MISAADEAARANTLRLESPPPYAVSRRTRLEHPQLHYAEILGVALRTVKRWHIAGIKARDACPLDDLAKFAAWWDRLHPGRAMDANVSLAVERALAATPPTAAAHSAGSSSSPAPTSSSVTPATPPAPAAADPARPLITLGDLAAFTLDENLLKLKSIHTANTQLLELAFASGTQAEVDSRHRNVERSAKMLIAAQTALDEHLTHRGDLLAREDVKRELIRAHTAMAQSLIGLLVQLGIHRARATTVADTWFAHLRQSRFAATTAPEILLPAASAA